MTEETFPKGYECGACGQFHRFSMWCYAHWDERITHTCQGCGAVNVIEAGEVVEFERATA